MRSRSVSSCCLVLSFKTYGLGGAIGLVAVHNDEGVTQEWIDTNDFTVETPQGVYPITLSIQPFYDPKRERILAKGY